MLNPSNESGMLVVDDRLGYSFRDVPDDGGSLNSEDEEKRSDTGEHAGYILTGGEALL